jgi:hypothetical protein
MPEPIRGHFFLAAGDVPPELLPGHLGAVAPDRVGREPPRTGVECHSGPVGLAHYWHAFDVEKPRACG